MQVCREYLFFIFRRQRAGVEPAIRTVLVCGRAAEFHRLQYTGLALAGHRARPRWQKFIPNQVGSCCWLSRLPVVLPTGPDMCLQAHIDCAACGTGWLDLGQDTRGVLSRSATISYRSSCPGWFGNWRRVRPLARLLVAPTALPAIRLSVNELVARTLQSW